MIVLILGGSGFIGRHVAEAALRQGHQAVIASRAPERARGKLPELSRKCELRPAHVERLLQPESWSALLEGVDAVVNCVGILREDGQASYERVQHLAPAALAAGCAARGIRLVHVSALGLHAAARSGFLRTKLKGEQAIRASGADWSLVRPSLLDGPGGYGAHWLRLVSRWPLHPVPAGARGRLAVCDVRELGEAIVALLPLPAADWREVELGGADWRTMPEHLAYLRQALGLPPTPQVAIPQVLARLTAHVCDLLRITPFSFGHLELMSRDNVPRHNRLPELLRRAGYQRDESAPAHAELPALVALD